MYALAVANDGGVYVGGQFTMAGAVAASNVARWDPATGTWSALGSGLNGAVYALAVASGGGGVCRRAIHHGWRGRGQSDRALGREQLVRPRHRHG